MKRMIFAQLLFFVTLFISACKDDQAEIIKPESAKRVGSLSEETSRIKEIIDANKVKRNTTANARTYGNVTWYFNPYGYQYTGSANQYSFPGSVYISNGSSSPVVLVISGQLYFDASGGGLECSGGEGPCYVENMDDYTNSSGYRGGKKITVGAGMTATFSFIAQIKGTGVEGWLSIDQIAPSIVQANWTDDILYVIRGSL
ncbi:MAG: hypothetical protein ACTHMM_04610 [Agriterribacter sp.]